MSEDNQGQMDRSGKDKYVWYIGDPIPSTGLWVRKNGNEYPIYENTRGQQAWYSFEVGEFDNAQITELSDAFIEWLAHHHRVRNGLVENESIFPASTIVDDEPDADPEWYEIELLNTIDNPDLTPEQEDLLEWAYEQTE